MVEKRRSFLKTAVLGSSVALGVSALASSQKTPSHGVVVGKSKKREITYTKTKEWEDFYKSAL